MSEYYTISEMEALYSQKACLNSFETETYILRPAPQTHWMWSITFKRMITGIVMINIYMPIISGAFSDGYVDVVVDEEFPRKFRPSINMYFMCLDDNNQSRCVGVFKEGKLRFYNSANAGCCGVISYIGMPVSDCLVQSYYKPSVYEAVTHINQLGSEWSSFVCVTDTHGADNQGHSQSIMRFILENSKATMGYWLGDTTREFWASYAKNQYMNFAEEYLNVSNRICFAFGNHDSCDSRIGVKSRRTGVHREIFNDFLCDKYGVVFDSYRNAYLDPNPNYQPSHDEHYKVLDCLMQYYYFIDDTATHTRYMVINTSQNSRLTLDTDTQLEWIRQCVHFGAGYESDYYSEF